MAHPLFRTPRMSPSAPPPPPAADCAPLPCQRALFDIPEDVAYFNCASMRIAPHLYTSDRDIDRLVAGIASISGVPGAA